MKLEDVNNAMVEGKTVIHEHNGYSSPYRITGVITRYDKRRGWWYALELHDLKADSITVADMEEVRVRNETDII